MYCCLHPCIYTTFRYLTKTKLKYVCICISFVMLFDYFGVFTHMFEKTYDENFIYPYEGKVHEFVNALKNNEKPAMDPINEYNYEFVFNNLQKCIEPGYSNLRMVYLIKSSIKNFDRRLAIRNSWGFEKRFFDVPSKTVFLLGIGSDEEVQAKVKLEASKYKDIIQANFIDSYYNNTIKTMMGFKWAVKYCSNSKFYMFVDDDIYVSVRNVLRFVRNPTNYPNYLREPRNIEAHKREIGRSDLASIQQTVNPITKSSTEFYTGDKTVVSSNLKQDNGSMYSSKMAIGHKDSVNQGTRNRTRFSTRQKRDIFDFELPGDVRLFAGFVIMSSPHRHRSSKWYVSLKEYPYHMWPPYVTAGAYILSKEALIDMYYTSLYTKHFRFDDIFLGFVAKKAEIEPFHCEEFHFYKKDYTKFNYKYVITSHGYGNPDELLKVWYEQKALGNA